MADQVDASYGSGLHFSGDSQHRNSNAVWRADSSASKRHLGCDWRNQHELRPTHAGRTCSVLLWDKRRMDASDHPAKLRLSLRCSALHYRSAADYASPKSYSSTAALDFKVERKLPLLARS